MSSEQLKQAFKEIEMQLTVLKLENPLRYEVLVNELVNALEDFKQDLSSLI